MKGMKNAFLPMRLYFSSFLLRLYLCFDLEVLIRTKNLLWRNLLILQKVYKHLNN